MIRHIVLFTLRPGIGPDDPRVVDACRAEDALVADLGSAGAHEHYPVWAFARDIARRPVSADFVGVGHFDSMGALGDFLTSEAHVRAAEAWDGLVDIVVADHEL